MAKGRFYAKPGSKAHNHILGRVGELLRKHPNASNPQLQVWSSYNNYKIGYKHIDKKRKDMEVKTRVHRGKIYYYVKGYLRITTKDYKEEPLFFEEVKRTFISIRKAKNFYNRVVVNFEMVVDEHAIDPDTFIEGVLNLNKVLKYGVRNIEHWEPF